MQKFFEFIKKYKQDILFICLISIVFILILLCFWGCWGSVLNDNARELCIPKFINDGKMLYRDIFVFAVYNPLPYQINTIFYKFFGANLNTLYCCTIVNAYAILVGIYLICRRFLKPALSSVPCLLFLSFCLCQFNNVHNYILPYSLAMVYSVCSFIYFCYFSVLFVKDKKINYSYLASLFLGISIACRFEFIFCYVPLMYYIIKSQISINCKQMIKLLCLNLLIFITPLFSTWSVLFMQGFSVNDLVFYINFIKNFVSAPETVVYTINAGCSFLSLFYGIKLIIKFTIIFVLLSLFNIFSIKNILSKNNTFLFLVSILLLLICILVDIKVFTKYFYIIFCPICLTTIWIIIVSFRKDKDSQCSALRLLCLFCLLSCIRTSFVFISGYYLYFIILPFIANFIYLIKEEHLATIQKSIVIYIILLCSIMFCYSFFVVKDYEKVYFPHQKSVIFKQSKLRTSVYNKAIKWIEINTNKNDRILVLPEGPMLNFITNRPTNYKYFHLVPSHITTVGEKNIVNDLKKDPPEYIFIQSLEYLIYGKNYFGIDFGKDIFIYIINNYNLVTQIKSENSDTEFFITIFKLKTKH